MNSLMSMVVCLLLIMAIAPVQAQMDGASLFETHCAICHESVGADQALGPEISVMRQMTPEHILEVMESGVMQSQAKERSRTQRYLLAEYLSGKAFGSAPPAPIPASAYCSNDNNDFTQKPTAAAWNGWGASIRNDRFQSAQAAGMGEEDAPQLRLKWSFGYPGATSGGTQPTVVGGRLYVGNAEGDVFSLDARSGCVNWMIQADAGVRSAISLGNAGPQGRLMAYFGDQAANAYGVDAETGEIIWKVRLDEHPKAVITGAPTLHEGRLYVPMSSREESQVRNPLYECCQFRGSVSAVDAASGEVIWKTYTINEEAQPIGKNASGTQLWGPSGDPVWNAPSVDTHRGLVYIGTGNNYSIPATRTSDAIIAMDMSSGAIVWVRQVAEEDVWNSSCRSNGQNQYLCPDVEAPDTDFGNSPVLVKVKGKDLLIAGNKLGLVYAFDPDDDGRILWTESTGKGATSGGIMWGLAVDGERAYAGNNYFNRAEPGDTGGISAIDLVTGKTVWQREALSCAGRATDRCKPSHAAALTVIPGVVFSGTMDGRLRALGSDDGRTLWQYDTAREFTTVNGIKANGGSMSNAGVTVVDGMVYVNSGYSHHGAIIPGNVLLAFTVE